MKNSPPSLTELFPRDLLARLQADCASILGGAAIMFRSDGSALIDLQAASPYCMRVSASVSGHTSCVQSRRDLAMEAMQTGKTQEAHCHAGVSLIAIPLMLSGEGIAATVISLHPAPLDRDEILETARTLDLDPSALLHSARLSAPLPDDRIQAMIRMAENMHRIFSLHLATKVEIEIVRRQVEKSSRRMKALYNTSRAISSSLSQEQTIRILLEQMTLTAGLDRCLIALKKPGFHELQPVGAHGLTPSEQQKYLSTHPLDLGVRPEWMEKLEKGKIVFLPQGWLSRTATRAVLSIREDRRGALIPVSSGGALWAVAYLDGAKNADELTQTEIDLILTIAGQAGIALSHINKYQQEQRIALKLQESLITPIPEEICGYSIGDIYLPALDEAQVGGDFFDIIPLDECRFALLFGDVSGKGIEAAVHTGMMKYMARGLIVDDPSPEVMVTRLNRAVSKHNSLESGFITFFYALIDGESQRIAYANAGHEPPLLFHAYLNEAGLLIPNGPAIGLIPDFTYPQEDRTFSEGDCLLLYTDGATEARNDAGEFYGLANIRKELLPLIKKTGGEIVSGLHKKILQFTGGGLQDDLALMAIKR